MITCNNETSVLRIDKKIPELMKGFFIIYNEHYKKTKIKKSNDSINILTNLKQHISFNINISTFIDNIIKLNKSILNFQFSLKSLHLIWFEFKNLKYISTKWNYFPFSIILRLALKIKAN